MAHILGAAECSRSLGEESDAGAQKKRQRGDAHEVARPRGQRCAAARGIRTSGGSLAIAAASGAPFRGGAIAAVPPVAIGAVDSASPSIVTSAVDLGTRGEVKIKLGAHVRERERRRGGAMRRRGGKPRLANRIVGTDLDVCCNKGARFPPAAPLPRNG